MMEVMLAGFSAVRHYAVLRFISTTTTMEKQVLIVRYMDVLYLSIVPTGA